MLKIQNHFILKINNNSNHSLRYKKIQIIIKINNNSINNKQNINNLTYHKLMKLMKNNE